MGGARANHKMTNMRVAMETTQLTKFWERMKNYKCVPWAWASLQWPAPRPELRRHIGYRQYYPWCQGRTEGDYSFYEPQLVLVTRLFIHYCRQTAGDYIYLPLIVRRIQRCWKMVQVLVLLHSELCLTTAGIGLKQLCYGSGRFQWDAHLPHFALGGLWASE